MSNYFRNGMIGCILIGLFTMIAGDGRLGFVICSVSVFSILLNWYDIRDKGLQNLKDFEKGKK